MAPPRPWLGGTSNLWNTASNWSGAAVPAAGSTLLFGAPGSSDTALSDDIASLTIGGAGADGIVFGLSASSYAITRPGAQALTAGSSAGGALIKNLSLYAQSMSVPITMSTAQTIQVGDTTGASLPPSQLGGLNGGGRADQDRQRSGVAEHQLAGRPDREPGNGQYRY